VRRGGQEEGAGQGRREQNGYHTMRGRVKGPVHRPKSTRITTIATGEKAYNEKIEVLRNLWKKVRFDWGGKKL